MKVKTGGWPSPVGVHFSFTRWPIFNASVDQDKKNLSDIIDPLVHQAANAVRDWPAPKRDLSGIWDATGDRVGGAPAGIQFTGVNEHRSVLPRNGAPPGGAPDERKTLFVFVPSGSFADQHDPALRIAVREDRVLAGSL